MEYSVLMSLGEGGGRNDRERWGIALALALEVPHWHCVQSKSVSH